MRQILVDHARRNLAVKRGAGGWHTTLEECVSFSDERSGSVLALNDALISLQAFDDRKCRIVELRFFGGLTIEETAKVLRLSWLPLAGARFASWPGNEKGLSFA